MIESRKDKISVVLLQKIIPYIYLPRFRRNTHELRTIVPRCFLPPPLPAGYGNEVPEATGEFFGCNELAAMPRQIEIKRRKKRSVPMYSSTDCIDSLLWKSYVLPARDLTLPIEKSLFNVDSRRGK